MARGSITPGGGGAAAAGALHAALWLGRDAAMLEVLLDGGASLAAARPRRATRRSRSPCESRATDAAAVFRSRGASDDEVSEADRLLGRVCAR